MAHGITRTDHMAYVGQTPWHGLGTKVEGGLTVPQMLEAARLTWKIGTAPLFADIPIIGDNPKRVQVGEKVMFRDDTSEVLDVVGPDYIPTQNHEALAFFEEYVHAGDMTLDTAGSLHGGRWVWGLAKMKVGFTLPGGDRVEGYLLVANANKYGKGLVVKFVLERVVCHNTLTAALNETGRSISLPHVREFDAAARADAKMKIGLALEEVDRMAELTTEMATAKLSDRDVNDIIAGTFGLKLDADEQILKMTSPAERVRELYLGAGIGADLESARGTAWGLLNAVTQYVDHEAGRGKKKNQDDRLTSAWFGAGESIKNRALEAIKRKLAAV